MCVDGFGKMADMMHKEGRRYKSKATCLNVHNLKGEILKWKLKERGVPVVQTSQNKDVKLGALYSMDCQQ
jgi:hypothetical protein